jgi:hypothetical protein
MWDDEGRRFSASRRIKAHVPADWSQTEAWVTVWLPGFLIDDRRLAVTAGAVSYRFQPEVWRDDFPNIDEQPVDTFVVTLSASGRDAQGRHRIRARQLVVQGLQVWCPRQSSRTDPAR